MLLLFFKFNLFSVVFSLLLLLLLLFAASVFFFFFFFFFFLSASPDEGKSIGILPYGFHTSHFCFWSVTTLRLRKGLMLQGLSRLLYYFYC